MVRSPRLDATRYGLLDHRVLFYRFRFSHFRARANRYTREALKLADGSNALHGVCQEISSCDQRERFAVTARGQAEFHTLDGRVTCDQKETAWLVSGATKNCMLVTQILQVPLLCVTSRKEFRRIPRSQ